VRCSNIVPSKGARTQSNDLILKRALLFSSSGIGDTGVENEESSSLRFLRRKEARAQSNALVLKRAPAVAESAMRALRMRRAAACEFSDAREPEPKAMT